MVKEAALFFEDTLQENDQGQLVVSPSVSPENIYRIGNEQGFAGEESFGSWTPRAPWALPAAPCCT